MRIVRFLTVAAALGTTLLAAQTASATSLDRCGDFFFDLGTGGDLDCELVVEGGCETACEPLAFEVSCAAGGALECRGECKPLEIDIDCSLDCEAGCDTECSGGEFDCGVFCEAGCSADCDAYCENDNDEHCAASCRANCSVTCDSYCNVELPTCETQCKAGCDGRCEAEISAGCNVECSSDLYLDCEASASGGCNTQCEQLDGALFCEGQWVDTDDLDGCVDQLVAYFDIEVTGYAEANCDGNECSAEAGGSVSCSAARATSGSHFNAGLMIVGLAGAGLTAARRLRRAKK